MLEGNGIKILGGRVPELFEAWDVERRYGALAKRR